MDTIKLLVPEIDTSITNSRQKMNFSTEGSARLKKLRRAEFLSKLEYTNHGI